MKVNNISSATGSTYCWNNFGFVLNAKMTIKYLSCPFRVKIIEMLESRAMSHCTFNDSVGHQTVVFQNLFILFFHPLSSHVISNVNVILVFFDHRIAFCKPCQLSMSVVLFSHQVNNNWLDLILLDMAGHILSRRGPDVSRCPDVVHHCVTS